MLLLIHPILIEIKTDDAMSLLVLICAIILHVFYGIDSNKMLR